MNGSPFSLSMIMFYQASGEEGYFLFFECWLEIPDNIKLSTKLWTLELSFNSNEFGRVLLVKPSMFGKLEVHMLEVVWRFEPITFYVGELRVKLILAPHVVLKLKNSAE